MLTYLYPIKVRKAAQSLLTKQAHCSTELRKAIEAKAARLGGADRERLEVPDELIQFVEKVALHAYKVSDEEFQSLKDAGYSQDQIFEVTLCASLGASLARFERGLTALGSK